jgi:hypothetical protein
MKLWMALLAAACALFTAQDAAAKKRFENSYVAFDMPDGWTCSLEKTEWVCYPPTPQGASRSMVIILAAKEVDYRDTLTVYQRHLNEVGRRPGVRTIEPVTVRDIGGNFWADGAYEGSELPNQITRYWAGVKDDIAVLVTFSVHKNYYAANRGLVDLVAGSLTPKPRRR